MVDNGTRKGIIERLLLNKERHVCVKSSKNLKKKILLLKRDSSSLCLPFQIIQDCIPEKEKNEEKSERTSRLVWVGWELYEIGKAMKDMNSLGQHINQVHRR